MADDPSIQLSLQQPTQELNNIVRMLGQLLTSLQLGGIRRTSFHNASGATGTAFTATGDQTVEFVSVSSTAGADAVTLNVVKVSPAGTHNIITDGVIGAAYPLYVPGPWALEEGDTITYSGADADMDFTITYRESQA